MLIALLVTTCLILIVLSMVQQRKIWELRHDKQAFRTLAENSPDPITRYDRNCRRIYVNPVVGRLAGRPVAELLGKPLVNGTTLQAKEVQKFEEGILAVFETGEPGQLDVDLFNQSDHLFKYHLRLLPEYDAQGRVATVLALGHDITELKRVEQDLKQALESLEGIVNAIPDLLFEVDLNGKYLNVWAHDQELLAVQKEAMLGKTIRDVLLPEAAETAMSAIEEADRKGFSFGKVIRIELPQGESWFELSISRKPGPSQTDIHFIALSRDITKRKRMEDELAYSRNFLDRIINTSANPIFVKDRQHRWVLVNEAFCRLADCAREGLIGKSDFEFFPEDEARVFWEGDEIVFESGKEFAREEEITNTKGERQYIFTRKTTFNDIHGSPILVGVISDITERKRMELQLAGQERELRTLLENIPVNIARYTPDARHMYMNPVTERTNDKSKEYFLGRTPMECFPDGRYAEYERRIIATAASGNYDEMEMVLQMGDGETQTHFIRFVAERSENGEVISVLTIGTDITPLKIHEQQLEHIAHHDALTGLPNRLLFMDRLNQGVAYTRRSGGLLAVCFGDLDGFKPVNDRYGHAAGDLVLVKIADRMKESVRAVDTVGRIGGDEFVVVLLNLESVQECETILTRLLGAVSQPIRLDGDSVSVTASLGVALFPQDDADPDTLLQHADQAMYLAKQSGKNIIRFYDPDQP